MYITHLWILVLTERDGSLSTLCHSWRFDYQQRVLKTFPGPGYLSSEDGLAGLWHLLVNFAKSHYNFTPDELEIVLHSRKTSILESKYMGKKAW